MSEDQYRQKRKVTAEDLGEGQPANPLQSIKETQAAIAHELGREPSDAFNDLPDPANLFKGNMPPQLAALLAEKEREIQQEQIDDAGLDTHVVPKKKATPPAIANQQKYRQSGSTGFEAMIQKLAKEHSWEEFSFPSKSRFYDDIPEVIHVRAMTGEEEQILATPRFVKRGKAMDMIFQKCIRENILTENLLSADRTYLLIYLRGISYTPEYDVEIKCPECSHKFTTVINLDLDVNECPEDFGPDKLVGTLPTSGFSFRYRLSTGTDEQAVSTYRERRIADFGEQSEDDTSLYRIALLLEEISGEGYVLTNKKEIQGILKKLPIADIQHLRNEINEPPFGVDTELRIMCPHCTEEFPTDLPLDANFFFPKKKRAETNQA